MSPMRQISPAGLLKSINDNFDAGILQLATVTYVWNALDANGVANSTIAAHPQSLELPAHALVVGGFMDVNTAVVGSGGSIAVHLEAANDIVAAAAVSGAPWSTIGRKAIVPKANTPESTSLKTTVARAVTFTVTAGAMTAGKVTLYLYWIPGVASA